jgi:hypothetical protein
MDAEVSEGLANSGLPRVATASLNGTVVAFAVGLSLITALVSAHE